MGYSKAQKTASRELILNIAAQQIKERGLESITIGELMKKAGLTNGAFYGHFASRNELLLEATKRAIDDPRKFFQGMAKIKPLTLTDIVDVLLSPEHIANPGGGCALCALAGDGKSAIKSIRNEFTKATQEIIQMIAKTLQGKSSYSKAVVITSTLIGTINLVRSIEDQNLIQTLIQETRKAVLAMGQ